MRFTKMQGAGNDYVYVDCFQQPVPDSPEELARAVSDRHFGVGADGLILIAPSDVADAEMRMFNADGSASEMCGNGIRCVAKYVYDHGICRRDELRIASAGRVLTLRVTAPGGRVRRVCVDMGAPVFDPPAVPTRLAATRDGRVVDAPLEVEGRTLMVTTLSMGNPHCVVYCDSLTDDLVCGLGPAIERHAAFPSRVNVEFVRVVDRGRVTQRTWERGSGETLACGTGASAVCVAGVLTGRTDRRVTVDLLGGALDIDWDPSTGRVLMTGPAEEVFTGEWPTAAPQPA